MVEQCLNLLKTSVVQKKRIETHNDPNAPFAYPRVHGIVFDPSTGVLCKVPIDYRRKISELRDMYDLFDVTEQTSDIQPEYELKKDT